MASVSARSPRPAAAPRSPLALATNQKFKLASEADAATAVQGTAEATSRAAAVPPLWPDWHWPRPGNFKLERTSAHRRRRKQREGGGGGGYLKIVKARPAHGPARGRAA